MYKTPDASTRYKTSFQHRIVWSKTLIAIAGLVFVTGFGYFGYAVVTSNLQQADVAQTFQPVTATVLSSAVSSTSNGSGHGGGLQVYSVNIKYRYNVAKHRYQSHRYAYTQSGFKDYADARKTVDRYPASTRFTAFYDPAHPGRAVIDRSPPAMSSQLLATPFVFLVFFGLLVLIHGIRGALVRVE